MRERPFGEDDSVEFLTFYNNNEVEAEVQLFMSDLIRESLIFSTRMEQHFFIHNPDMECNLQFG